MAKHRVYAEITSTYFIDIEANDKKQALEDSKYWDDILDDWNHLEDDIPTFWVDKIEGKEDGQV